VAMNLRERLRKLMAKEYIRMEEFLNSNLRKANENELCLVSRVVEST
jgi:hypothetical protein